MKNQQQNILCEKGIDISHWQGEIDWEKVAAEGIKHVFLKMSEGGTYTDPNFVTNWNAAKNAGLKVNAYHYFRALNSTPEEQFANIKRNLLSVGFDPAMNGLAIDVEAGGNESASKDIMADHLHMLLNLLNCDLLDVKPIIYCSPTYWDSDINWEKYDFSVYPLWVANWNVDEPHLPKSWEQSGKSWSCWQYSSKGKVDGIRGDVDLDWIRNYKRVTMLTKNFGRRVPKICSHHATYIKPRFVRRPPRTGPFWAARSGYHHDLTA